MSGDLWCLDASAFVKLVRTEPGSIELQQWTQSHSIMSCDLLRTEARQAFAHAGDDDRQRCERLLERMHLMELSSELLDRAGRLPPRNLRSLDAVYLACAMEAGNDLAGLVSYDQRQLAAGASLGIVTASPGAATSASQ